MNSELISVIIPIFNTDAYLDRCVASVLQQSYENLEILLIDDGSTDKSGAMCDSWAGKDPRIRVIHKENQGVASARNTGLDNANGDYIAFVDSDDFIAPDMMLKLHHALTVNSADISICNYHCIDEGGEPVQDLNSVLPIKNEVISGLDALWYLQLGGLGMQIITPWNKLYRKSLFLTVRYPAGKYCEDAFIAHKLFMQCPHVACISDVGYYYTQRKNSIMHKGEPFFDLHCAGARLERIRFFKERELFLCAGNAYWRSAISLVNSFQNGFSSSSIKEEQESVLRDLRQQIHLRKYCSVKKALQISIICLNPDLYRFLFRNSGYKKAKALWQKICFKVTKNK